MTPKHDRQPAWQGENMWKRQPSSCMKPNSGWLAGRLWHIMTYYDYGWRSWHKVAASELTHCLKSRCISLTKAGMIACKSVSNESRTWKLGTASKNKQLELFQCIEMLWNWHSLQARDFLSTTVDDPRGIPVGFQKDQRAICLSFCL